MLEYALRELEDDMFDAHGDGRPNETDPRPGN